MTAALTAAAMRLPRRGARRCRALGMPQLVSHRGEILGRTSHEVQHEAAQAGFSIHEAAPRGPADSPRVRRLKDMLLIKEMRLALTSGEFALRLDGAGRVDCEGLCKRLDQFANKLEQLPPDPEVLSKQDAWKALECVRDTRVRLGRRLAKASTEDVSEARGGGPHEDNIGETVIERSSGSSSDDGGASSPSTQTETASMPSIFQWPPRAALPGFGNGESSTKTGTLLRSERILLYLREDDTVDIEATIKESSAVMPLSGDLTERLKGTQHEGDDTWLDKSSVGMLKSSQLREKERVHLETKHEFIAAELWRNRVRKQARGSTLEDGKTMQRALAERMDRPMQAVEECRYRMILAGIDLLLERAGAALEREVEKAAISEWDLVGGPLKELAVEFSLMDKTAEPFHRVPLRSDDARTASLSIGLGYSELRMLEANVVRFADRVGADVEGVVEEEHGVLKSLRRRLGGMRKSMRQLRHGLSFYKNGGRILGQDIQHVVKLVLKAACLKQRLRGRELQLCYRAVKDVLVLLPFLVILVVPLSPPGHLFVFSLLRKVFPDFFPSPFTERRQNVMKIYNEIKLATP